MPKDIPRGASWTPGHWALSGNYAPVQREIDATELPVTGIIPNFLDGRYVRIGPNPISVPDPARYQMFFGTGMVHGLRLIGGQALWYRNRWVRAASAARALGEKWTGGPSQGGIDFAAYTNVIQYANRTLALGECGVRPYELSENLDTVSGFDFGGTLRGGYAPLPKRDPKTGELHAISYSPLFGHAVRYTVADIYGCIRHTVDIKLTAMPLMHDFSLTERYVVVYDQPVVLNWDAVARGPWSQWLTRQLNRISKRAVPDPLADIVMAASARIDINPSLPFPFLSDQNRPTRVGVLPRDGTAADLRWFEVPRCFIYHGLNAHDDGDQIFLDIVRHPDMFVVPGADPMTDAATLDRWIIDLVSGNVRVQPLDDRSQEFPRVDDRLVGQPYRYGYCVSYPANSHPRFTPGSLLRHDVLTESTIEVSFGGHRQASEFIFVPSGENAGEDDGVLMGFVYNSVDDRSDLVLLDAATLHVVGTVHLPARVPNGFHGNWMPTQSS
ncbi:carotenoid oxygenase [Mycobacteroides franklinii]|uniref:Dioxygenase n=1 Tax=Mycobacteroides franklinii TaxID=948102 RepID=A0A1S1LAS2_9MYCO|nr:carotenoid oxygenase family protein [Mycobacteroides franklinii]OHU22761.1 carotenoid oxygenase [Mycobacteroides franklinii]